MSNQIRRLHRTLLDFEMYSTSGVPTIINNTELLLQRVPTELRNPVICFLLNRTVTGVVDSLVNELWEATKLIQSAQRDLNLPLLDWTSPELRDLKRARNKLLAHRYEVSVCTDEHKKWYRDSYGSYPAILVLLREVNEILFSAVREVIFHDDFSHVQYSARSVEEFKAEDVEVLLSALKQYNIY